MITQDQDEDRDEAETFTLFHISDLRLRTLTNDYKQLFPNLSVRQIHDALLETRGEGLEGTYARLETMAEAQRHADRNNGDEPSSTPPNADPKAELYSRPKAEPQAELDARLDVEPKAEDEDDVWEDEDEDGDEAETFTLFHISDQRLRTLTNDYKQRLPNLSVRQIHDTILETRGEGPEGTCARLESMAEAQRYADRGTGESDEVGGEGDGDEEALWKSGEVWRAFVNVRKDERTKKRKRK